MLGRGGIAAMTIMTAVSLLSFGQSAQSAEWRLLRGEWARASEFGPVLIHRGSGEGVALWEDSFTDGAFRCLVEPSLSLPECGLSLLAASDTGGGYRCGIGGAATGLWLAGPTGELLWQDATAPLAPYTAVWLEGVVEGNRVRVQILTGDGKELISQGPWVELDGPRSGSAAGVFSSGGPARFRSPVVAAEPLSPVVDDPPNLRRLGNDPDWALLGGGLWMWAPGTRDRIQQMRPADRAWAIHLPTTGTHRVWRTWVRVQQGTGGAGMEFLVSPTRDSGLLCWLGGEWGNGCLMLYSVPLGELWQGPSATWHYDTDYLLEAETRAGEVRVRLCDATGQVLSESPWVTVADGTTERAGHIGFQTWIGLAEFWGFAGEGTGTAEVEAPGTTTDVGMGWQAQAGQWSLEAGGALVATAEGVCVNRPTEGAKGTWRVTVTGAGDAGRVSLLFQAAADLAEGFAVELDAAGVRLLDLALTGQPRWQATSVSLGTGTLTLEGVVETDRVRIRVLRDGQPLVESPTVYVSDRNNTRRGILGVQTGGPATFSDWGYEPAE